jgi:hypothetical protein
MWKVTMNKSERDDLARLARQRAKLAKADAAQREKILLAEIEDLIAAEFAARDELWAEAVAIAEEAAVKANGQIAAQCALLGIAAKHAPGLELRWRSRSSELADSGRRSEVCKLAEKRLAALTAAARLEIDRRLLATETALIAPSLESEDARAFLAAMPSAEQLMPSLSLGDLGVRTWQPPEGAASELLTPSTTADRRRRKVLRAIEANPAASDREIARIAGVDHKTVAAYRRSAGELPAAGGEFPGDDDGEDE